VGSCNGRRKSLLSDNLIPSHYWPNRRPYLVKALKAADLSIIGTQEFTRDQAVDVETDLGPNWTHWGGDGKGNGPVLWNTEKWLAVDTFEQMIPADGERYMVGVRLQSRPPKELGQIWIITLHLTVGGTRTAANLRHAQIRAAIRVLQTKPDWGCSLICGDFNSDGYNNGPLGGVRTIAAELGFQDLRTRLRNDQVKNYDYSSVNGWKATPKTGRWVDDILTPAAVEPYDSALSFTHFSVNGRLHWGSDHNVVRASVEWPAQEGSLA